jgi:hypothetical protein
LAGKVLLNRKAIFVVCLQPHSSAERRPRLTASGVLHFTCFRLKFKCKSLCLEYAF